MFRNFIKSCTFDQVINVYIFRLFCCQLGDIWWWLKWNELKRLSLYCHNGPRSFHLVCHTRNVLEYDRRKLNDVRINEGDKTRCCKLRVVSSNWFSYKIYQFVWLRDVTLTRWNWKAFFFIYERNMIRLNRNVKEES